jgi:hypothetical protein
MKKFLKESGFQLLVLAAIVVLAYLFYSGGIKFENQQIKGRIVLISPPQEVLEGRVRDWVISSVYTLENYLESQTMEVNLCSGEVWVVPQSQFSAVKAWLESGLAPHKGCN